MEVCPYSYFRWCGYFRGPGYHLLWQMSSQWGSQKLLQGLVSHELTAHLSVFNLYFTRWIIPILSKGCTPDNFESHNSLKLSFTNIRGPSSNFVDCESFLESNSPDILALCEANLDDSVESGNFSVTGYLPLIQKDSITHMHGLEVYVKEGIPFARDLSLGNSTNSYLFVHLTSFTSLSILHLFPLSITFFVFMHEFWYLI